MKQQGVLRSESGLTLMELIIVLAIIAIIGAILAPNFLTATDKARLKSDIQSAKVIQAAIELYEAEHSEALNKAGATDASTFQSNILSTLQQYDYLKASQSDGQTDKAYWAYDSAAQFVKVNITACSDKIKSDIYHSLTPAEQNFVMGSGAVSSSTTTQN
ncbi:MAG: prepilin-type N-terminal cleavage/methylation domain-containing protein [Clostridiales bacterium]|nr:prepilin-type N-terminal cleavage/methylation domain-containing protein [Clostridiales bacterium]